MSHWYLIMGTVFSIQIPIGIGIGIGDLGKMQWHFCFRSKMELFEAIQISGVFVRHIFLTMDTESKFNSLLAWVLSSMQFCRSLVELYGKRKLWNDQGLVDTISPEGY